MAVAATDLVFYCAANIPEADTGTAGGAIDPDIRVIDRSECDSIDGGAGDTIDLVSAAAGDTQNCYLAGVGTDGSWLSETVALNGTTHVQSTNTYLHLRKVELASAAAGAVTVAAYQSGSPVTLTTIVAGEKGYKDPFLRAEANAAGGAAKAIYAKVFLKNTHATDALQSGVVWLSEDEDSELTMDLEMSGGATVTGGSETTTNRVTEPSTGGTYSWGEHATEGAGHVVGDAEDGNLIAAEAQGIWLKLSLAAGRTPEQQVQWTINWSGSAA